MPVARTAERAHRCGQAMVETILVLFFLCLAFYAVFQFADNLRARLLADYAASRVARARTVGFNDFMLEKTARLATLAAAGECYTRDAAGKEVVSSAGRLTGLMPSYLACENEAQTRQVLDFELWRDGKTRAACSRAGAKLTARVVQLRPQFFDLRDVLQGTPADGEAGEPHARIEGAYAIEAHYPDWIE